MQRADALEPRLEVHQVVEAVDQRAQRALAAEPVKRRCRVGHRHPARCLVAAAAMPIAAGAPGACANSSSRLITDSRTDASNGTSPSSSIITGWSRPVLTKRS